MYDVQTGQPQQVAQHDAPIRAVRWVDSNNGILATGSWDKTVKVRIVALEIKSRSCSCLRVPCVFF